MSENLLVGLLLGGLLLVAFCARYGSELKSLSWAWRAILGVLLVVGNGLVLTSQFESLLKVGATAFWSAFIVGILPEYLLMLLGAVKLPGNAEYDGSVTLLVDRLVANLHGVGSPLATLIAVIDSSPLTPTKKAELRKYWRAIVGIPHH